MNALGSVATEDQAFTEYYQMAALGEARVLLLATLASIEFEEVRVIDDESASATTAEVWDYIHQNLDTGETMRTEVGVEYRLRYDLVIQDGRWLVDAVTTLEESGSGEATPTP